MNWINALSKVEITFLFIFLLTYLVYLVRIYLVGRVVGGASRLVFIKFILRTFYILLLIGALLGPSFGKFNHNSAVAGRDLYIAVDLSASMDANDVQPSRLEKAKFELSNFVERLKNNRIGLIVFSSEAYVYSPLTYDKNALKLYINQLSTKLLPNGSSHLSAPLNLVVHKFATTSQKHIRSLLLISDGEDFGGIQDSTIRSLQEKKITVFAVGVGTTQGGSIPKENGFKKDKNGAEVLTKLNAAQMQSIAVRTGGKYFRLSQEKNDIDVLIDSLNALENPDVDMRKVMIENNRYYYFLWLALVLIFIDISFTIKVLKI